MVKSDERSIIMGFLSSDFITGRNGTFSAGDFSEK